MKVYYYERPDNEGSTYHATLAEAKKAIHTYMEIGQSVAVFLVDVGPATRQNIAAMMNGMGWHNQETYITDVQGGKEPEED